MADSKRILRIAAMVAFALGVVLLVISLYKQAHEQRGAFGAALGTMVIAGICYGVGRSPDKRDPP